MKTREEALSYGLSFPDTYQEAPFHDDNWQLIRVKGSKKAFLWVYEKDGIIQLNVKATRNGGTTGAMHSRQLSRDIIRTKNIGTRFSSTEPYPMTLCVP